MKEILVATLILLLSGLAYSQEVSKAGNSKEYYKNGQLKFELIVNDDRRGAVGKFYNENGLLETEIIHENNDFVNGVLKSYYKSGKLESLKGFKDDKEHGFFIFYNESGRVISISVYKDGDLIDYHDYNKDEGSITLG